MHNQRVFPNGCPGCDYVECLDPTPVPSMINSSSVETSADSNGSKTSSSAVAVSETSGGSGVVAVTMLSAAACLSMQLL